jgi:hypothetical protein
MLDFTSAIATAESVLEQYATNNQLPDSATLQKENPEKILEFYANLRRSGATPIMPPDFSSAIALAETILEEYLLENRLVSEVMLSRDRPERLLKFYADLKDADNSAGGSSITSTDDLPEGTEHLYYTDVKAAAVITANRIITALGYTPQDTATAFNGDYAALTNKPVIPTKTSDLANDINYITVAGAPVQSVAGKAGVVELVIADIIGLVSALAGKASSFSLMGGLYFNGTAIDFNPGNQGTPTPLSKGGTSATTAAAALTNLGALATTQREANNGVAGLDSIGFLVQTRLPQFTSFTPVLRGSSTAGTFTYVNTYGRSQRVNNAVNFNLRLAITGQTVAPAGNLQIGGFPVNAGTQATGYLIPGTIIANTTIFPVFLQPVISSNNFNLLKLTGGTLSNLVIGDINTSNFDILIQGRYQA